MYDTDEIQIESEQETNYKEYFYKSLEAILKNTEWYEARIFELYSNGDKDKGIKPGSARSISRITGISRQEILRVIKEIKQKANEHFNTNYRHLVIGTDIRS